MRAVFSVLKPSVGDATRPPRPGVALHSRVWIERRARFMRVVVIVPVIDGEDRYDKLVKLMEDGWTLRALPGPDPAFTHADVTTEQQARERLAGIGLDPDVLIIQTDAEEM
jgi:hypothetical protein